MSSANSVQPASVVQIVQHLAPGGLETLALDLQRHSSAQISSRIISLEGELESAIERWPLLDSYRASLHFLNKGSGLDLDLVWRLRRLLRELRPTAIHTHHIGPLLYGGIAARLAGVPRRVHTEHDAWHLSERKRRWIAALALALSRPRVVAVGDHVRSEVIKALPNLAVEVILNGIDIDRFRPADAAAARTELGLPLGVKIVGCAARLEEVKGHRYLLEAIAKRPGDLHLALAGVGTLESALREQAAALGIGERVHFLGRIDRVERFYPALDLFCLPSLAEGMPLSPLEAQACGVAVVASDVGGVAESLCRRSGRLVPSADAERLADAIAAALNTPLESNPRDFVLALGGTAQMVRRYEQLYGVEA